MDGTITLLVFGSLKKIVFHKNYFGELISEEIFGK